MFYVIEHQKRPDGIVNTSETARNSFNAGLSLFHDRYSKMLMTDQFVSVALMLVDDNLNVLQYNIVDTMYQPAPVVPEEPEVEVEEPAEETSEE